MITHQIVVEYLKIGVPIFLIASVILLPVMAVVMCRITARNKLINKGNLNEDMH